MTDDIKAAAKRFMEAVQAYYPPHGHLGAKYPRYNAPEALELRAAAEELQAILEPPKTRAENLADPKWLATILAERCKKGYAVEQDVTDAICQRLNDDPLSVPAMTDLFSRVRQDALDEAWRIVDACGGIGGPAHYNEAIRDACNAIEKAGGRDPDPHVHKMRETLRWAAETFQKYARLHGEKSPPDVAKQKANAHLAKMCFAALEAR